MEEGRESVEVSESKLGGEKHVFVFVLVTILMVAIVLIILFGLKISGQPLTVLLIVLFAFYVSGSSILLEPQLVRQILKTITRTEQKEVIVERPVIRDVVREVEVPVREEVIREVEKKVYVETPRVKLNIPHYEYLASSEAKTYHSRNCRLGKLIKRKYKISNNERGYFVRKGFVACKVCITKVKKV